MLKKQPGNYHMLVRANLYHIQRLKINSFYYWVAENVIAQKKAFRSNTKKSLITKILQHHGNTES
jgi:hypothetical protein